MLWIGLTGGLASGKTSVADILRKKNIAVVCADALARIAVEPGAPGLKAVVAQFGKDILTTSGSLDRKKLANKVFGQKERLLQLEAIIHPIVRRLASEAREKLKIKGEQLAFYDVPLLFEKKMEELFDKIVVVFTTEENQRLRAISRDKTNEKDVKERMSHQMALKEKINFADFVIENNAGLRELEVAVDKLLLNLAGLYQPQE